MASPTRHGGLAAEGVRPGSAMRIMDPIVAPGSALCRGKSFGSVIRALWKPGWARLATSSSACYTCG